MEVLFYNDILYSFLLKIITHETNKELNEMAQSHIEALEGKLEY